MITISTRLSRAAPEARISKKYPNAISARLRLGTTSIPNARSDPKAIRTCAARPDATTDAPIDVTIGAMTGVPEAAAIGTNRAAIAEETDGTAEETVGIAAAVTAAPTEDRNAAWTATKAGADATINAAEDRAAARR